MVVRSSFFPLLHFSLLVNITGKNESLLHKGVVTGTITEGDLYMVAALGVTDSKYGFWP
jgi:hypothetical protein